MSKHRAHKAANEFRVGDVAIIYGMPIEVVRVRHLNRHPFQLMELYFKEFHEPIRVGHGQQLDYMEKKDD